MLQHSGEDFTITHDPESNRVSIEGTLRLNGIVEYEPVSALLEQAIETNSTLILDLRKLEFLNSSGIATLSKFVLAARKLPDAQVTVLGSKEVAWQRKSLTNLQRLMPTLMLELD